MSGAGCYKKNGNLPSGVLPTRRDAANIKTLNSRDQPNLRAQQKHQSGVGHNSPDVVFVLGIKKKVNENTESFY